MFLDDNSSDEYEIDCVSDESTGILNVDSKVRVDEKEKRTWARKTQASQYM